MVTKNELRRINLRVYLQENRDKDLDELAALTGYTKEYLQKQFKVIGIKPRIRGRKTDAEIEEYIKAHPQMSVNNVCGE